jgi:hypothetical protein
MKRLQALLPQLHDCWAEMRPGEPGPTANAPGNTFTSAPHPAQCHVVPCFPGFSGLQLE